MVLVFCTLLADFNAFTTMAVALQSHVRFDWAPGLQLVSHHPLPAYLLKLTESTGGTHTHTRTHAHVKVLTQHFQVASPFPGQFLLGGS